MNALLEIDDVCVHYDGVRAVDGVSLRVQRGEIVGLIGPNGAGKTTLLKVVIGIQIPETGSVRFDGRDLSSLPVHVRVRLGLAVSQQFVRPFASMTVLENVMLASGYAKTLSPWSALFNTGQAHERYRAAELLALVGISEALDVRPQDLPLAYLKRMELARTLALDPKLLLLDEPLAGLNQGEARNLANTVVDLNKKGVTVVLIEHNLSEVLRICPRVVVLDNGRVISDGTPDMVISDRQVRTAYLGEGQANVEA